MDKQNLFQQKYGDVSLGYSKDISPNDKWREMGLQCEWEHCIEMMPCNKHPVCPIFGHLCPGGEHQADKCNLHGKEVRDAVKKSKATNLAEFKKWSAEQMRNTVHPKGDQVDVIPENKPVVNGLPARVYLPPAPKPVSEL